MADLKNLQQTMSKVQIPKVTLTDLEMEIQYLEANLANGWHETQEEKNEVSAELEQLKRILDMKNEQLYEDQAHAAFYSENL